ncbi:unnamed protein product [Fusarium equiseti]|uniref:Apple domain-containing protein n=1 Tax=Fusarium equiseti TaxID=61235 RepID=A0A8J2NCW6_FUSEQ|nr:unnamed protein product [Fusarium equiseti]
MFHSFILYLAFLASLFTITIAQSCETSGTYDTCCKSPSTSSDGKVLSFQGSEFRVHCNKVIIAEYAISASTLPACAKICKDDQNCVVSHWTSAGCEKKLLTPQPSAIALVPIDAAYQAKAKRDLKTCQDQATKCKNDLDICRKGTCCSNLTICQTALSKKDAETKACVADKDKCHKDKATCETAKGQCEKDKNKCNTDKNKKCQANLKKCKGKKKTTGPFKCSNGKREKIGGVTFLHRCDQVARPKQWDMVKNPVPANDARECAAMCAKQGLSGGGLI